MEGIIEIGPKNVTEFEGKKKIAFKFNGAWYNIFDKEEVLLVVMKTLTTGNKISFDFDEKKAEISNIKVLEAAKPNQDKDKNWADDMTNFEDLLSNAHSKFKDGLQIKTKMVQVDFKEENAIFKARVITNHLLSNGEVKECFFEAYGDATKTNVTNKLIQPHFIRMAETRAIARALRWATNNANVAEEEI